MDQQNKALLNLIQADFPLESRPFLKLAQQLDMTEEQVINRIKELKDNGYIRRMGGIFNSKKLGYFSTLCAIKVPAGNISEVAALINSYAGVTHNYIRNHSYNIWFTIIANSPDKVEALLSDIRIKTGIEDIINLPAVNLFKINVNFDIKE